MLVKRIESQIFLLTDRLTRIVVYVYVVFYLYTTTRYSISPKKTEKTCFHLRQIPSLYLGIKLGSIDSASVHKLILKYGAFICKVPFLVRSVMAI